MTEDPVELRVGELLDRVASAQPGPAGGTVAALVVAMAAGLCAMAARLATDHLRHAPELVARSERLRARATPLARADAQAYARVLAAPREQRREAARSAATDVPLEVAGIAAEVADLAGELAHGGKPDLRGDALTAVCLAEAVASACAHLVAINLAGTDDVRIAEASRLAAAAARMGTQLWPTYLVPRRS